MTAQTHRISPTLRVCVILQDGGALKLTQERRSLPGGHAWCVVGKPAYLPAIAPEAQA